MFNIIGMARAHSELGWGYRYFTSADSTSDSSNALARTSNPPQEASSVSSCLFQIPRDDSASFM